jgi:nucleoside-diphosphate-sugar epimerase/glycosyltransferase involved in cell wall biosynthesis
MSSPRSLRGLGAVPGPVLVHGANGFIGANLLAALLHDGVRAEGTVSSRRSWRLEALGIDAVRRTASHDELLDVLKDLRPRVVFSLAAHGAYPEETDNRRMVEVNVLQTEVLARWCAENSAVLVHAGSSSEYGTNAGDASEDTLPSPNSFYAVTKLAGTNVLANLVHAAGLRATTLRLFSVFGPLEGAGRLVPTLIRKGAVGQLPLFSPPQVSRDFVFVDDVIDALCRAAVRLAAGAELPPIINVSSGFGTTMAEVAEAARHEFGISDSAVFTEPLRAWDLARWSGRPDLAVRVLDWRASTGFAEGLSATRRWYAARRDQSELLAVRVRPPRLAEPDISAVVACYRDAEAIPHMAARLRATFERIGVSFEIVFVNDASPDEALSVIEEESRRDERIIGITHSRNFGSQSAFLSGMLASRGRYVVLLDGDLQDPPELIDEMWRLAAQGYEVVFGRRVDRQEAWWLRRSYRAFYVIFQRFAPFHIPRDAGDFSLMSRRVVDSVAAMPERGLFIRAQRAYAGFRQIGVDYIRPARPFGRSTNSLARNVGWATRGILAVSRAPLTAMSVVATALLGFSLLVSSAYAVLRLVQPEVVPRGITTLIISVFLLGSLNFFGVAVVGEYVGRVLEESKGRPRFIRSLLTEAGVTRLFVGEGDRTA